MSGRSKLEDDLAFAMAAVKLPAPVRQLHPMWCCPHTKREHGTINIEWYCRQCYAEDEPRVGPGHACYHAYEKTRDWAVDFAWPDRRLIVEVEGGVYTQGRHTRPAGFIKDIEKYNALTLAGWTLLRFSRREVKSGEALNQIERALAQEVA